MGSGWVVPDFAQQHHIGAPETSATSLLCLLYSFEILQQNQLTFWQRWPVSLGHKNNCVKRALWNSFKGSFKQIKCPKVTFYIQSFFQSWQLKQTVSWNMQMKPFYLPFQDFQLLKSSVIFTVFVRRNLKIYRTKLLWLALGVWKWSQFCVLHNIVPYSYEKRPSFFCKGERALSMKQEV